jgi:hypothetical protein
MSQYICRNFHGNKYWKRKIKLWLYEEQKIYINNWIQGQINTFNYQECNISYEGEKDFKIRIVNLNTRN